MLHVVACTIPLMFANRLKIPLEQHVGLDETVDKLISESDRLVSAARPEFEILAVESLEVHAGLEYKPAQYSLPGRGSISSPVANGLLVGECPRQIVTKFVLASRIKPQVFNLWVSLNEFRVNDGMWNVSQPTGVYHP